jgi:hypothetical protein
MAAVIAAALSPVGTASACEIIFSAGGAISRRPQSPPSMAYEIDRAVHFSAIYEFPKLWRMCIRGFGCIEAA